MKNYRKKLAVLNNSIQNPRSSICGPGGIRTRDLFSTMDKNAGEKAKIAVYYV
jgi:hypothetical protein